MNEEMNEMMLDLDTFDFSMIDDEADTPSPAKKEPIEEEEGFEGEEDTFEGDEDSEEVEDDASDLEEEEHSAPDFDEFDDAYEFNVDGVVVTKADMLDTVRSRNAIKEAQTSLFGYMKTINEANNRMDAVLRASISESEMKLQEINSMLDRPSDIQPSRLQALLQAKKDTQARLSTLEDNAMKLKREQEEAQDALNLSRITQTDMALRGTPEYHGIDTIRELAQWAQKLGVDGNAMMAGMSPALVKVLMDAKKYNDVKEQKTSKVRTLAKPVPKSSSAKKPASKAPASGSKAKQEALKRVNKGDFSNAFDFLED